MKITKFVLHVVVPALMSAIFFMMVIVIESHQHGVQPVMIATGLSLLFLVARVVSMRNIHSWDDLVRRPDVSRMWYVLLALTFFASWLFAVALNRERWSDFGEAAVFISFATLAGDFTIIRARFLAKQLQ